MDASDRSRFLHICANFLYPCPVGTYQLAIACQYHGIPFFVASPTTTIDLKLRHGRQIHIEERPAHELTHVQVICKYCIQEMAELA